VCFARIHSEPFKECHEITIIENAPNPKVQRFRERHHKHTTGRINPRHHQNEILHVAIGIRRIQSTLLGLNPFHFRE